MTNFIFHSCRQQIRLVCVVEDGEAELIGKDCINPSDGNEVGPFFEGTGDPDGPCPYKPTKVAITYEICNFDPESPLILDQKKTQLKYDSTDITPTSIFANPIAPEVCVTFVHRDTWDLCDVPADKDGFRERAKLYSIKVEGYLQGAEGPPGKGMAGSKGSKSSKSSKSKGEASYSKGYDAYEPSKGNAYSKGSEGRDLGSGKDSKSSKSKGSKSSKSKGSKSSKSKGSKSSKSKGSKSSKSNGSKSSKSKGTADSKSYCYCKLIDANSLCQLSKFPMCSLFSLFCNRRLHYPSFFVHVYKCNCCHSPYIDDSDDAPSFDDSDV